VCADGQVAHSDLRRVHLPARSPDRDERNALGAATHNQEALVLHGVDRVDHEVKAAPQNLIRGRRGEELAERLDLALWVDGRDPHRHCADLRPTNGPIDRMNLSVRVRDADVVHIDERQPTDARAHQGLSSP
jgi:hypothetical protein